MPQGTKQTISIVKYNLAGKRHVKRHNQKDKEKGTLGKWKRKG
jgi:hypothetical protein